MKRSEQVSDMSNHTNSNSQRSRLSRSDPATRIPSHLSRAGVVLFVVPFVPEGCLRHVLREFLAS